jgi:hypothetical protein
LAAVIGCLLQAVRWAQSFFGLSRLYVQRVYSSDFVQLFVATLIVANFVANCLEAQFVGEFEDAFKTVETIFTSASRTCTYPTLLSASSSTDAQLRCVRS